MVAQLGMGFMIHGGCADHACTKPLDDAWLMQVKRKRSLHCVYLRHRLLKQQAFLF